MCPHKDNFIIFLKRFIQIQFQPHENSIYYIFNTCRIHVYATKHRILRWITTVGSQSLLYQSNHIIYENVKKPTILTNIFSETSMTAH